MYKNKTIGELLLEGDAELRISGNEKANEEAVLLLSYLLNRGKFEIFLEHSVIVSTKIINKYFKWINARKKGVPIQYITGFQNFMGLEFKVKKGVFIPRPETEILVAESIKIIESLPDKPEILLLDIGVGTGVIPISICNYFKESNKKIHFYAIDISKKALKLAKDNAKRFQCEDKIDFFNGNTFAPLKKLPAQTLFDGIISNPPYISKKEMDRLPDEIYYHEPTKALFGGSEGLDYYKKIIYQAPEYLKKRTGFLALEIGHKQKKSVCKIIKQNSNFMKNVKTCNDYFQNDRVVLAFINGSCN